MERDLLLDPTSNYALSHSQRLAVRPAMDSEITTEEASSGPHSAPTMYIGAHRGMFLGLAAVALAAIVVVASVRQHAPSSEVGPLTTSALASAGGVVDIFTRSDSTTTLGVANSGQRWKAIEGTWGIRARTAYLAKQATRLKTNLVVITMGAADGLVMATDRIAGAGSGLVFRYSNEFNYWSVRSVPALATWDLVKVVNGKATDLGAIGLAPTGDGTTVSVFLRGPLIDIFVDGVHRRTVTDSDLRDGTRVGLVSGGGAAARTRWADFIASPQREPTVPSSTTSTSSGVRR